MSDNSGKKRSNIETARRIWLAGIGAYGRAFSEAQGAIKDVSGETSRVFDELVKKGESIETTVTEKGKDLIDRTGVPSLNMDDRIAKMRSRLMRGEDVASDMSAIDTRLSRIEGQLEDILSMLNKLDNAKAPPKTTRKASPRKTSSSKSKS